ncbi:MAG: DUF3861 domain-containing protein [Ottowia sp.]|nr:DUF3861 domain-containing protein [Ottowia sp.]
MKHHRYRITVEHLADKDGAPVQEVPIVFEAPSHDDIAQTVQRAQQGQELDEATAQRMVVGLKLLGEVILENRGNAFFDALGTHFRDIMKAVKGKA